MSKRDRQRRHRERYFRRQPRRVLPVFVGQCPDCDEVVQDLYLHLVRSHGWQLL